jgi:hypothetical protein
MKREFVIFSVCIVIIFSACSKPASKKPKHTKTEIQQSEQFRFDFINKSRYVLFSKKYEVPERSAYEILNVYEKKHGAKVDDNGLGATIDDLSKRLNVPSKTVAAILLEYKYFEEMSSLAGDVDILLQEKQKIDDP